MVRFKGGSGVRNASSCAILNRIGRAITVLLIISAAAAASAAPKLSKVSCGKNAFTGAGTDACSVYLTSKTTSKYYVSLTSNSAAVIVPSGVTVKPGALSTGFNATVSAVATAQTATITAQGGGVSTSYSISLSPATAAATAAGLSVNATSISFGSVVVNTPVSQPVTLTSTGTAAVSVSSATVSGTGFSVSGATFPVTLNPGQSVTVNVQFDPTTVGSFTGQLSIASSASNKTVALSGTGTSHQVQLSWQAPASSVTGYNVYRAASGSTSYQRLNSTVDTLVDFTDATVQSGASYTYMVKSVDAQGTESAPSNLATVTVP